MQQETPEADQTARMIAENVFAAYMRQAEGGRHPQTEQTLVTRLIEAIQPEVPGGTPRDIIDAANGALDAWEQLQGGGGGPRITALNRADGSVGLSAT